MRYWSPRLDLLLNFSHSFGSLFFPRKRPDIIMTFVKSLLMAEPPAPFLFAVAGAPLELVTELETILQDKDMVLLSPFAPQMTILSHLATGWFVVRISIPDMVLSRFTNAS